VLELFGFLLVHYHSGDNDGARELVLGTFSAIKS